MLGNCESNQQGWRGIANNVHTSLTVHCPFSYLKNILSVTCHGDATQGSCDCYVGWGDYACQAPVTSVSQDSPVSFPPPSSRSWTFFSVVLPPPSANETAAVASSGHLLVELEQAPTTATSVVPILIVKKMLTEPPTSDEAAAALVPNVGDIAPALTSPRSLAPIKWTLPWTSSFVLHPNLPPTNLWIGVFNLANLSSSSSSYSPPPSSPSNSVSSSFNVDSALLNMTLRVRWTKDKQAPLCPLDCSGHGVCRQLPPSVNNTLACSGNGNCFNTPPTAFDSLNAFCVCDEAHTGPM